MQLGAEKTEMKYFIPISLCCVAYFCHFQYAPTTLSRAEKTGIQIINARLIITEYSSFFTHVLPKPLHWMPDTDIQ